MSDEVEFEDMATAEADEEFGTVRLTIADLDGREWSASAPYPDDDDIEGALHRLRGALAVLAGRAEPEPYDEEGDEDA